VTLTRVNAIDMRHTVGSEQFDDAVGLALRHHFIIRALEDSNRVAYMVGVEDWRPSVILLRSFRERPDEGGVVVGFKLMGIHVQRE